MRQRRRFSETPGARVLGAERPQVPVWLWHPVPGAPWGRPRIRLQTRELGVTGGHRRPLAGDPVLVRLRLCFPRASSRAPSTAEIGGHVRVPRGGNVTSLRCDGTGGQWDGDKRWLSPERRCGRRVTSQLLPGPRRPSGLRLAAEQPGASMSLLCDRREGAPFAASGSPASAVRGPRCPCPRAGFSGTGTREGAAAERTFGDCLQVRRRQPRGP